MTANEVVTVLPQETDYTEMKKSIRSWAIMLVISGVLSFFVDIVLDPGWGIVLITVAILSWKIKNPAMFIIYSVVMGWAAFSNFLAAISGEIGWLVLAIPQVIWTVACVKQYQKFRHLQTIDEVKVLGNFSKASGVLSIVCMVLPPVSCIGVVAYILSLGEAALATPSPQIEQLFETYSAMMYVFVNLALLALGFGIAGLTTKTAYKGWAIAGVVMSSIMLASLIVLAILGTIGQWLGQTGALPLNA